MRREMGGWLRLQPESNIDALSTPRLQSTRRVHRTTTSLMLVAMATGHLPTRSLTARTPGDASRRSLLATSARDYATFTPSRRPLQRSARAPALAPQIRATPKNFAPNRPRDVFKDCRKDAHPSTRISHSETADSFLPLRSLSFHLRVALTLL